ncbi:hypothetical protein KC926_01400 [Candidatus Kaiserbacteria bacterium]|nr:hypothetical protein [Candidatus Kaiserbacteria bacterium]
MKSSRDTIKNSKVTLACVGLLFSMIVMYLYFLNMSVVQVVMRSDFVQQKHQLNTEIAQLEAKYIESQHKIATRIATLEGYDTNTPKIFVSREAASFVLGGQ